MSAPSWTTLWRRGWLTSGDPWAARRLTLQAAAALIAARWRVRLVPFGRWSAGLGLAGTASAHQQQLANRLARHVERAAWRLPGTSKCLPQAMALSHLLRVRSIPHRLTLAVRPRTARGGLDDLHAWVSCGGVIVLGDLPGPWIEVLARPHRT